MRDNKISTCESCGGEAYGFRRCVRCASKRPPIAFDSCCCSCDKAADDECELRGMDA